MDKIDDLRNKLVRSVGELMQNLVRNLIEEMIVEDLYDKLDSLKKHLDFNEDDFPKFEKSLSCFFDLTKGFKKFFLINPLSQIMDDTNPLSELTHKRRLSSFGVGGLNKENVKLEVREIHPSHFCRICPIETSEGKNAGLVLSLAKDVRVNNFGFIESPFYL